MDFTGRPQRQFDPSYFAEQLDLAFVQLSADFEKDRHDAGDAQKRVLTIVQRNGSAAAAKIELDKSNGFFAAAMLELNTMRALASLYADLTGEGDWRADQLFRYAQSVGL